MGFFAIFLVMALISYVLSAIGLWKMFQKAGKPGWPSLIPVYNTYVLCEIIGVSPWWLVISVVAGLITVILPVFNILSFVINVYFGILLAVSTVRSFGKNDAYAIGVYFASFIFYLIFGLGNDQYVGPKPMNDVIFHNFQEKNPGLTIENVRYCSNCGAKVATNSKYCSGCGKEL